MIFPEEATLAGRDTLSCSPSAGATTSYYFPGVGESRLVGVHLRIVGAKTQCGSHFVYGRVSRWPRRASA